MSYAQLTRLEDQQDYFEEKYPENQTALFISTPAITRLSVPPVAPGLLGVVSADNGTYADPNLSTWSVAAATRIIIMTIASSARDFSSTPTIINNYSVVDSLGFTVNPTTGIISQPPDSVGKTFYITFNLSVVMQPVIMVLTEIAFRLNYSDGATEFLIAQENIQSFLSAVPGGFERSVSLSGKVVGVNTLNGTFYATATTVDGSVPNVVITNVRFQISA